MSRKRISIYASVAFLFVSSGAVAKEPPNRVTLELAVHQYYARLAEDDLGGLEPLWSDGHMLASTRRFLQDRLRARCITVKRLLVTKVAAAGDAINVTAEVDIEKQDRVTGQIYPEWEHPVFHFVRDGGSWRIAWVGLDERYLAEKIASAITWTDAWNLIASDMESVDPTMVQELYDYTLRMVNIGRMADANKAGERLLQVAEFVGDPGSMSLARSAEGMLLRVKPSPDLPGAMEKTQQSVALAERSGDPDLLSRALLNLARTYEFNNMEAQAAPLFERVLQLGDRLEARTALTRAALQLEGIEEDRGDYRAALRWVEIGRQYLDVETDHIGRYVLEYDLGNIFVAEGDYEVAAVHLRRAADAAEYAKFQNGIAGALGSLAASYQHLGDDVRFRATSAEALKFAKEGSRPEIAAAVLESIGADALDHGDLTKADEALTESLAKAESGLDPIGLAGSLRTMALLRLRQRRYSDAIALAGRAADIETKAGPPNQLDPWVVGAKAYRATGNLKAAESKLREAVALAERSRAMVTGDERQARLFFKSRVAAHLDLADLLVEEGHASEALEVAEQAKGRALLDALRSSGEKTQISADERTRQEQLESAVAAADRDLAQARASRKAAAEIAKASAAVDAARAEIESFRALLTARDSRIRHDAPPLNSAQLAAAVPARSVVVEYVVTDSRLLIFAIARGDRNGPRITVHSVVIGREALERKVRRFVSLVAQRSLEYERPAKDLYRLLFQPVASEIAPSRAVCIIPDSLLWSLPFEALIAPGGHFVAERQALFYAPSIAVLREMTAEQSRHTATPEAFFGVANPRVDLATLTGAKAFYRDSDFGALPDAEREVERIAGLYGAGHSAVFAGANAVEGRVKREIGSYRIIHFATHGVIDDRNPMYSYLLLSRSGPNDPEDGLLEAREMMQLDLHADLAVLSACDTARGTVDAGEGLIGMTWALFVAGCPSTIASQWKVDSQATASLMIAFYRAWLGKKHNAFAKAAALRQARLEMIKDRRYRHPYYWSAFVLVGAGG
ncbi:MAG TPA: CHAT domain-containing protein [Thermoanaerobaculia bacterium]|nr:CHAT domain-containing protein [Thermoanaerobaculia bacterium]